MTTRGSLAVLVSFIAFVAIGLPLDRSSTAPQQVALSVLPWTFLAIALLLQPRAIRVQVGVLVAVATALECFGSTPIDLLAIGPFALRREDTT